MQIILEESEIMLALKTYVETQVNIREDQQIDIELKAGRGENGISATLKIGERQVEEPVKKRTNTRAAKAAPEPAEVAEEVAAAPEEASEPVEEKKAAAPATANPFAAAKNNASSVFSKALKGADPEETTDATEAVEEKPAAKLGGIFNMKPAAVE